MQRRAFLQFISAAASVGAVFPSIGLAAQRTLQADPLTQLAQRFKAARKTNPILAGWESIKPPGTDFVNAELQGRWPKALQGTLYRNGPGLFERGGQRYQHWFDGDGLIQAWRIGENGIRHHSKFVETKKHRIENKSDRFEVMAAGTTIPNARAVSGPDDANTANISVMQLGGKTYALWEAGSAFEINSETLETVGAKIWRDDLEGVAFSAHPVYEPDGSIWNVGLFDKQMIVYHVGADGKLIQAQLVLLPHGGYMHSFTASETQLVFVLAPMVRVRDAGSYFEGLGWRPEQGSLMVVLPKSDLTKPRIVNFDSGAAYHYADAWDEPDGGLALRACWYKTGAAFASPLQNYMQGDPISPGTQAPDLVEIRLAKNAKRASVLATAHKLIEFPIQTRLMRQSSLLMLQAGASAKHGVLSSLLYIDAQGKRLAHFDFGADFALEEQLFVRADGKNYALGTIFNVKTARTGIVLFDLKKIGDGPIAQAWLDGAMPLGFHGTFVGG
jgi:all-trans-8'-apo-beta-carotenal 15,15'-oxygenase